MNKASLFLLVLPALTVNSQAFGEDVSLEEMGQRCQEARERNIAPLRQAAIEECVSRRRTLRTREDCERMYEGFGQGGGTVNSGFRAGMFIDLPECVEYFEAQDRQRNRRRSRP